MNKVDFYKARCLLCLKRFDSPQVQNDAGRRYYYIPGSHIVAFTTYNFGSVIDKIIQDILDRNEKLQSRNDDTKGWVAWALLGCLADGGPWTIIDYRSRCPHCGKRFSYVSRDLSESVVPTALAFNEVEHSGLDFIEEHVNWCIGEL